jgi:hypothetical protein
MKKHQNAPLFLSAWLAGGWFNLSKSLTLKKNCRPNFAVYCQTDGYYQSKSKFTHAIQHALIIPSTKTSFQGQLVIELLQETISNSRQWLNNCRGRDTINYLKQAYRFHTTFKSQTTIYNEIKIYLGYGVVISDTNLCTRNSNFGYQMETAILLIS